MKVRTILLRATTLLLLGAVLLSQIPLPGPAAPPLSDDDVSSLVTGEFSGNTHVDAVVLANGTPVLRESVETYQTYLAAQVAAVDIARLKGTGAGGRDQLVAVGPGGLWLLELQDPPSSQPWASTNLRGASTYWASAVAVRTGQVDGLYGDDIVAVTPGRVLIAKSNGAGGWTNDVTFFAGANTTGIELLDWDGLPGGALELAVLIGRNAAGAARIRLMKADATLITNIYSNSDVIIASPLASEEDGPRWLAAVGTTVSTGAQELVVLSVFDVAGPWNLGAAGVRDSVAGDWNGDGLDDLVLNTNTSRDAWLYRTWFASPSHLTLHPLDAPPDTPIQLPVGHPNRGVSVQDGRMDVADVDLDGDLDLVTAVQGEYQATTWNYIDSRFSSVDVTLNDSTRHWEWIPWHEPGAPWPNGLPLPALDTGSGDLIVPLVTPFHVIDEAARFEYAVWRTPSIESLAIPTPIFGPEECDIGQEQGTNGLTWSTLTIPIGQYETLFPDRYTLIARQVLRDPDGKIQAEGPALKVTFFSALHSDEFSIDWNIASNDHWVVDPEKPDEDGGASAGPGLPPTPPGQRPP